MHYRLPRLVLVYLATAATAAALPVDFSAPAGALGPTTEQGSAVRWVEIAKIDFGGGLTLPVRLSFLGSRNENGRDFGQGQWRCPLHDSRLMEKKADRWPILLPCGKVMLLHATAGENTQWATAGGEWLATTKGAGTVVSRADGWEMEFNRRGQLIRLRNDAGRNILWIRDANGVLQSLAEAVQGRPKAPAYIAQRDAAAGRVESIKLHTTAGEEQWKLSYDSTMRLRLIAFPDTSSVSCAYTTLPDGNPEIAVTGRDAVTNKLSWNADTGSLVSDGLWTYDIQPQRGNNPVMRRTGPGGEVEIYHDDVLNHRLLFTSAEGTQTIKQKVPSGPAKGRLQSVTRVLGEGILPKTEKREQVLQTYTYDSQGLVETETDALGHKTVHTYVLQGSSVHAGIKSHTTISPLGARTVQEYDRNGSLISQTDALGHVTRYENDEQGRRVKTIGPDGTVVQTVTYNSKGKVETRTNAFGHMTRHGYDSRGYLTSIVDPLGNTIRQEFDARGNRVTVIDALGNATRYRYDAGNRLTDVFLPDVQLGATGALAASGVRPKGTHHDYDDKGRRIRTTEADGTVSNITTYDVWGRVTSLTNALGHVTKYEYDIKRGTVGCNSCSTSAQPTRIIAPRGRVTERAYDADQHVVAETVAAGTTAAATTLHTYDLLGRRLSITNPLGHTTKYQYDAEGRRVAVVYADQTTRTYAYNLLGQMITETDELGHSTKREYDMYGNVVAVTDPEGRTARTWFGEADDASGAPKKEENSSSKPPAGAFAAFHRPTMTVSAAGVRTATEYDALGRRIAITTAPGMPEATTVRHVYDAVGNEIASISKIGAEEGEAAAKEQKTQHSYDARQRRIATTDALNRTWRFVYNNDAGASGPAPCCGADPALNSHATTISYPDGSSEEKIYNAVGQLVETRDANITSLNKARRAENRELQPGTRLSYDPDGRLTELTDANGNTTKWEYDARGKLQAKIYPDHTVERYEHDAAGRLASRVRQDSTTARYTYDARGRTLKIEWSDNRTENSRFAYDASGHLKLAENKSATIQRVYSPAGRLEKETQMINSQGDAPNGPFVAEVGYEYDPDGRLSKLTYPDDSTVSYSYNPRGELATVSDSSISDFATSRHAVTYTRSHDGKVTQLTLPNGTTTLKSYDGAGRLSDIRHLDPAGKVLFSEASQYDQRGRRTARVLADGRADLFAYDHVGQITAAAYGVAWNGGPASPEGASGSTAPGFNPAQTFEYDLVGNRTFAVDGDVRTAYQTNTANQYIQIQSQVSGTPVVATSHFDKLGNLLTDGRNTYVWDADIHLLAVTTRPDGPAGSNGKPETTIFRYDALHRRVARHEAASNITTLFVHDNWNVIAEYQAVNNAPAAAPKLASRHLWGEDISGSAQGAGGVGALLCTQHHGAPPVIANWTHYDSNGNIVLLTSSQAGDSARYAYDAYGKPVLAKGTSATTNGYQFSTKKMEPVSGLIFYGYRYYDVTKGRWLSSDPLSNSHPPTSPPLNWSPNTIRNIYKMGAEDRLIRFASMEQESRLFTHNSPINNIDVLGGSVFCTCALSTSMPDGPCSAGDVTVITSSGSCVNTVGRIINSIVGAFGEEPSCPEGCLSLPCGDVTAYICDGDGWWPFSLLPDSLQINPLDIVTCP